MLSISHEKYVNKCISEIPISFIGKDLYNKLLQLEKQDKVIQTKYITDKDAKNSKVFVINAFTIDTQTIAIFFQDITYSKKTEKSLKESDNKMNDRYICNVCRYIYDPLVGDEIGGIDANTAFEDLPEDWVCPICGAGKEEFEKE